MESKPTPLFIVGCGRSGTQALARLFSHCDDVEMHHEYMVHHIQPLSVKYFHNRIERQVVLEKLSKLHGAAISFCEARIWGDSSNKLSWFIPELIELFPTSKFIHVVRDGRKVTSSLFHKLNKECFDDKSVACLYEYMFGDGLEPPPEKKYWWPFAHQATEDFDQYWKLDQFGRMAFHWSQINDQIEQGLSSVPKSHKIRVRLEDVTANQNDLFDMMRFAGIKPNEEHFNLMKRPHNVVRPENNPLNQKELETFWDLCRTQMERYNYANTAEYILNYDAGAH